VFTVITLQLIDYGRSPDVLSNLLTSRIKSLKNIITKRGQENVLNLLFTAPFSSDSVLQILQEKGYKAIVVDNDSMDLSKDTCLNIEQGAVKTQIIVSGITCASCVAAIEKRIVVTDGVIQDSVSVSLIPPKVELMHFKSIITPEQVANIIEEMGYTICGIESISLNFADQSQEQSADFLIGGMSCSSCVAAIEKGLQEVEMGIMEVNVSLLTHKAKVVYNPQLIGLRDIKDKIEDMGYTVSIANGNEFDLIMHNMDHKEFENLYYQMMWSLFFVIPTFFISMIIMMVLPDGNALKMWFMQNIVPGLTVSDLLLFILATPVQFGLGWRFFDGAFRSLVYAKTANVRYFHGLILDGCTGGPRYGDNVLVFSVFID
jgi:Cu+-exporting ATPase